MNRITEIGQVEKLQVTPRSLIFGTKPNHYYSLAPLQPVEELLIEPRGITGMLENGERVIDHHHMDHPATHFRGANTLSIGFTAHYEQMQARFGDHMHLGCAAENIIIRATQRIQLADLRRYVLIGSEATGWVVLSGVQVAAPCNEFSRFALNKANPTPAEIKATLQFLHEGMRGFYLSLAEDSEPARVQVGDLVLVTDAIPDFVREVVLPSTIA